MGLLALLCYPFEEQLLSRLAVLTALPYFVAIANDLRRCGYKRSDALRLYGFNLLLLPVNLAGTGQRPTFRPSLGVSGSGTPGRGRNVLSDWAVGGSPKDQPTAQ